MQLKHIFPLSQLTLATTALLLMAALACEENATTTATEQQLGRTTKNDTCMKEGNMIAPSPTPTGDRIHEVRLKYDSLFWRQPNVWGVGEGYFKDGNGGWIETLGIVVDVTKKVDQNTPPPEDRIPDCLGGVPVQGMEGPEPVLE